MTEILQRFCALDKRVDISIIEEALGGGWDALHSKRSDIAIGVTGELPKGQYQVEQIGEIEFVFVVAKHHPLAEFVGEIESQHISNIPLLSFLAVRAIYPIAQAAFSTVSKLFVCTTCKPSWNFKLMG